MSYPISLELKQKNAQTLRQLQHLIMSPQMQQAIALLQVPILELSALIEQELEQNPLLEYSESAENEEEQEQEEGKERLDAEINFDDNDFKVLSQLEDDFKSQFEEQQEIRGSRTQEDDKFQSYLESSIQSKSTLFEHLMSQAEQTFASPEERRLAEAIIGDLDERGFLQTPLKELAGFYNAELKDLRKILHKIQEFDPSGVGARDLRESLLIQLKQKGKSNSLAYRVIETHWDDLLHNRVPLIQKDLNCTAEEVRESVSNVISRLDLRPGTGFGQQMVQSIVPDAIIRQEGDALIVVINDETLPFLRLNSRYLKLLEDDRLPNATKNFIKTKLASAKWLLRNIDQRNRTLETIVRFLAEKQKPFFSEPEGELIPMTMKLVADEAKLHESTIARAVANKYISSPRGIHPLKYFFTNAYTNEQGQELSARTVKNIISELVQSENKKRPLSDEAISNLLEERGIHCARRTVAKYRAELNIGKAQQRRQYS